MSEPETPAPERDAKPPSTVAVARPFVDQAVEAAVRIALLATLVVMCFRIVEPFLVPIAWGIILAVAVWPGYEWLLQRLGGHRVLAAVVFVVIAILVLLTTVVVPFTQMMCLFYILFPLKFGRLPKRLPWVLRFLQNLQPWGMMEVFMVGILVSVVKLAKMAKIIPGISLYSFLALIFVLAAMTVSLDAHQIWQKWEAHR